MIAHGTTRVRSYAQVDVDCGLETLDAALAAKEKFADRAEVHVIAFAQAGILREPGTLDVLDTALRFGATAIGGLDPGTLDRDPKGVQDRPVPAAIHHRARRRLAVHQERCPPGRPPRARAIRHPGQAGHVVAQDRSPARRRHRQGRLDVLAPPKPARERRLGVRTATATCWTRRGKTAWSWPTA